MEYLDPERIVYEDNHLLVVNKPAGLLVQEDHTGRPDLLTLAKGYLKEKYRKPGKVFLGLVHRLDRPVSGVLVLARTSKAAARLSAQVRERSLGKTYVALVEGTPPHAGRWRDRLGRRGSVAFMDPAGKEAVLRYARIRSHGVCSRVTVSLVTGRHHQIRLQFAHRGFPVIGDRRYGAQVSFGENSIALHASELTLDHPTTRRSLTFASPEPGSWSSWLAGQGGRRQSNNSV